MDAYSDADFYRSDFQRWEQEQRDGRLADEELTMAIDRAVEAEDKAKRKGEL